MASPRIMSVVLVGSHNSLDSNGHGEEVEWESVESSSPADLELLMR